MGAAMRYQPQGLLRINPDHPLAAGLVGFWLPNGGQFISAVPGMPAASLTSAAALASGPKGRVLKGDGSKVTGAIPNDSRYLPTSAITVLVDGISANAGNQYWFTTEVSSNGFGMYAGGAHVYMRIGGAWADVGTGILAGEVCQGGMTYDGSTFWSIKNGKRANSMGASGAIVQGGSGITLGGTTTGGAGGGALHYFAIWNRSLSPADLANFYANPWQIFDAGSSSSTYQAAIASTAPAAGGTATAISATTGALQLSGLAASVASTLTINASAGAQTLAGQSATVAMSTTVAASAAGESLVGLSASIIAPAVIAASAGNMVTSGLVAAVALPVVVSASLATESLSGKAASIALSTIIACSAAPESLSGLSAAISTGSGIGCSLASMSMAGYPVQIIAPITIAAQVAGIAATGLSASVTTGAGISCNAANLQAFGLTASIVLKTTVNAGLATSSMVGMAASIATLVPVGTITVPSSRTASFAGVQRVAAFNGKAPISIAKGTLDELYFVGDFTKDLADAATSAASVAPVSSGVTVLEGPTLQGALGVVKIGAMDTSAGAKNLFTFRVTCVNNEQFDRTIQFTVLDDRTWTFGKDPDDLHFFAFDMGKDSVLGKAALSSATTPAAIGVTASASAVIQGNLAIVMIGGMDTGSAPVNSCGLTMTFANTEKIVRAIYFTKEDH